MDNPVGTNQTLLVDVIIHKELGGISPGRSLGQA